MRRIEANRLDGIDGVLFDLDGVLTPTADVHEAAWKRTFDDFLATYARGAAARPFTHSDYRRYVDGMPRLDGVRSFLGSRGIVLPEDDPERSGAYTIAALAERKNDTFQRLLGAGKLAAYPDAVALLDWLRGRGLATAVVSASHNCSRVLAAAAIIGRFDAQVDGYVADRERLRGKPAPDTFLFASEQLGLRPEQCAVLEDAIAGVQAGRAGGFGLVVGVDRNGHPSQLLAQGADMVVRELTELIPDQLLEP